MVTEAIVLAGGLGTRLRTVVADVPKPMAPIGARPFLAYVLDQWIEQGIRSFTLSVGYRHDVVTGYFGSDYRGAAVRYAIEDLPLGTGGALLRTLASIGPNAPVLVLNGDTYFDVDLDSLVEFAGRNKADIAFALFHTDDVARYMGMEIDAHGRIVQLQGGHPSRRLANGGVYWINPEVFLTHLIKPNRPMSLETDVFPELLRAGYRFFGRAFPGTFIDIGIPDDYRRAQSMLLSSKGPVDRASF